MAGSGGVFWELVHDTGLGSAFGFVFPRAHMDSGTVGGVLNSKFSRDALQPREGKAKGLDIAAAAAGVLHRGGLSRQDRVPPPHVEFYSSLTARIDSSA